MPSLPRSTVKISPWAITEKEIGLKDALTWPPSAERSGRFYPNSAAMLPNFPAVAYLNKYYTECEYDIALHIIQASSQFWQAVAGRK